MDVTDPVLNDGAASYTPGISERRSSTTKFYEQDRLGTTERILNTSQSTTDSREYDAFGLPLSSTGSTPTPFGFAGAWGYQEDADSGLKLLGHRYYDASTGRFLTRDPLKVGRNWYTYCENDPVTSLDPSGLDWHPEPWQGDARNRGKKTVIVIGEPSLGRPQEAIALLPGERDPDNFDVDDIGIPNPDGSWSWYHNEIEPPWTSSGDIEVGKDGRPRIKNPNTAHLVPIPKGSKEYDRLDGIRKRGAKRKGTKDPKPIGTPIGPEFVPKGAFRGGSGSIIWP